MRAAYERGETDEFVTATTVGDEARIRPGDSVIAFNFRPDRMREITQALADPGFGEVDRGGAPPVERYATHDRVPTRAGPTRSRSRRSGRRSRSRTCSPSAARRQLHVAETEKYPHVTYFFNGGEETPYAGERRELVASPRDVPTYDHKPQMSAPEAAAAFVRAWNEDAPRFGIINFANADMVGHTGVIPAAVAGDRDGRPLPRRGRRGGPRVRRRAASSPPTMATPTTCSRPTARRTPRTRSTRCR